MPSGYPGPLYGRPVVRVSLSHDRQRDSSLAAHSQEIHTIHTDGPSSHHPQETGNSMNASAACHPYWHARNNMDIRQQHISDGGHVAGPNSRRDPALTKREILDSAAEEFAEHGPHGARTEDIARRTNTSKRMIFYYFGTKEDLYTAVLRENYVRIRSLETQLDLAELDPIEALRTLIRATMDHIDDNPQMARIVAVENLLKRGSTVDQIPNLRELNSSAIATIQRVLNRGIASGVFRDDPQAPDALDVHQVLSALTLNRIEHRETFRAAFGRDMLGKDNKANRVLVEQTVLRLVLKDPSQA